MSPFFLEHILQEKGDNVHHQNAKQSMSIITECLGSAKQKKGALLNQRNQEGIIGAMQICWIVNYKRSIIVRGRGKTYEKYGWEKYRHSENT